MSIIDHNAPYAASDPCHEMQDEALCSSSSNKELDLNNTLPNENSSSFNRLRSRCRILNYKTFQLVKKKKKLILINSCLLHRILLHSNATDISPVFLWQSDGKGTGIR